MIVNSKHCSFEYTDIWLSFAAEQRSYNHHGTPLEGAVESHKIQVFVIQEWKGAEEMEILVVFMTNQISEKNSFARILVCITFTSQK